MKKIFILILCFITLVPKISYSKSVWYCEWETTVMIIEKDILRTALDGKRFNMQVDNMTVTFTKGSSLFDKYSIKDTWGSGKTWEFIAGSQNTIISFNEGKLHVVGINRMSRSTSSKVALCEKF